jgi:hypothetical protein
MKTRARATSKAARDSAGIDGLVGQEPLPEAWEPAAALGLQGLLGNQAVAGLVRAGAGGPDDDGAPGAPGASNADPGRQVPFRAEMEAAFGQDFSRVEATRGAPEALGALGARAAAAGENVAFADTSPDRETMGDLQQMLGIDEGGLLDGLMERCLGQDDERAPLSTTSQVFEWDEPVTFAPAPTACPAPAQGATP